ncbi:hypothetical protein E7Z57_03615 [Ralstonia pseudosolanacearum]|uniref:Uncharacterized protein n=1 Tax=Ralstonia solanacearum TaxID=305 RepID=A0AA92EAG0_RALSL|nr:hypothetical protein E7Z57_03615 [Ralstonia pseudosolanacearum]
MPGWLVSTSTKRQRAARCRKTSLSRAGLVSEAREAGFIYNTATHFGGGIMPAVRSSTIRCVVSPDA